MKVLAVNGSARNNGNTHMALEIVAEELKNKGIDVEIIDLVDMKLHPFSFGGTPEDDVPMLRLVAAKDKPDSIKKKHLDFIADFWRQPVIFKSVNITGETLGTCLHKSAPT